MESLNSSMKAVLITPLVSSLEFGCGPERSEWQTGSPRLNDPIKSLTWLVVRVYLEVQECIQLVLNDGQSLDQLLCVHGAHHTFGPEKDKITCTHRAQPRSLSVYQFLCARVFTLSSFWWSPLLLVCRTWLFHLGSGCSVWWKLTCYILKGRWSIFSDQTTFPDISPFEYVIIHWALIQFSGGEKTKVLLSVAFPALDSLK